MTWVIIGMMMCILLNVGVDGIFCWIYSTIKCFKMVGITTFCIICIISWRIALLSHLLDSHLLST